LLGPLLPIQSSQKSKDFVNLFPDHDTKRSHPKAPRDHLRQHQNILDTADSEFGHDPNPGLRFLGLLDPDSQDLLVAKAAATDGQKDHLALDRPFIMDLDVQDI